jgi:tetratricopeptide (TPR) repeat protein
VKSERHVGDYRAVEGVLFPFRSAEIEIATGKELNSDTIQSIEINPPLAPSFFSPPEFKRTALQQFLEQLYMERSDKDGVLWSYRGFRSANPEIDSREGVEFIGYQMAKMGDFDSAVELLKNNAADYPASASAQYGLGRAYKGKGDVANARAAFEKALQIDPNFKKATAGLDALR